jgi:CRP/FNR family transcriptional regulator
MNPAFPKTDPEMINKLAHLGFRKEFKKGESIQNEQAYIHALPIVSKGTIRVMQADEENREMFLYYINPGETCIMSFLGGMQNDVSKVKAVAEKDSEVLMIPIDKLDQLIKEFPEWIGYIFGIYYSRFEELLEVVNELTFKKMDERLLSYLQKKKAAIGSYTLSITHEQIANDLGTARVVISRLLKQLEKEELIELGRNKITLL